MPFVQIFVLFDEYVSQFTIGGNAVDSLSSAFPH